MGDLGVDIDFTLLTVLVPPLCGSQRQTRQVEREAEAEPRPAFLSVRTVEQELTGEHLHDDSYGCEPMAAARSNASSTGKRSRRLNG